MTAAVEDVVLGNERDACINARRWPLGDEDRGAIPIGDEKNGSHSVCKGMTFSDDESFEHISPDSRHFLVVAQEIDGPVSALLELN